MAKKSKFGSNKSEIKDDLNTDTKEETEITVEPKEQPKKDVPAERPIIDRSNPITMGAFFSTSKQIDRTATGYRYLKIGFEKVAKRYPYRQSMPQWESDYNKFCKE